MYDSITSKMRVNRRERVSMLLRTTTRNEPRLKSGWHQRGSSSWSSSSSSSTSTSSGIAYRWGLSTGAASVEQAASRKSATSDRVFRPFTTSLAILTPSTTNTLSTSYSTHTLPHRPLVPLPFRGVQLSPVRYGGGCVCAGTGALGSLRVRS